MKTSIAVIIVSLFIAIQHGSAESSDSGEAFSAKEQVRLVHQPGVTPDGTEELIRVMKTNRFTLTNIREIQQRIRDLDEQDIPVEPLMSKVHEGLAKDIEPQRIVTATERVQQRYEYAYREARKFGLDETKTDTIGDITAKTLAAGLKVKECDQIMEQLRIRTRVMEQDQACSLITETLKTGRIMAHRDVDSTMVAELLTTALRYSYNADDVVVMRQTFMKTIRARNAEMVAQHFSYNISNGIKAGQLGTISTNGYNGKPGEENGSREARGQGHGDGTGSSNDTGGQSGAGGSGNSGNNGDSGKSGNSGGNSGGSGGSGSGGQGSAGSSSGGQGSGGNAQGTGGKGGNGR